MVISGFMATMSFARFTMSSATSCGSWSRRLLVPICRITSSGFYSSNAGTTCFMCATRAPGNDFTWTFFSSCFERRFPFTNFNIESLRIKVSGRSSADDMRGCNVLLTWSPWDSLSRFFVLFLFWLDFGFTISHGISLCWLDETLWSAILFFLETPYYLNDLFLNDMTV